MKKTLFFVLFLSAIVYGCQKKEVYRQTSSVDGEGSEKIAMSNIKIKGSIPMKAMVKEFKAIKNPIMLSIFFNKYEKDFEKNYTNHTLASLPKDYLLAISLLYPFKPLKGIGDRFYGFFKKDIFKKKEKAVKEAARYNKGVLKEYYITKLQSIASYLNTYLPSKGNIVFKYFVEPDHHERPSFKVISHFQDFLMGEIYPRVQKMLTGLYALGNIDVKNPIAIDLTEVLGKSAEIADNWRYYYINDHEVSAMKSLTHKTCHDMILFSQYNRDDLLGMKYKKTVVMSGITKFLNIGDHPGMAFSDMDKVIKKYPRLYTMRNIPFKPKGGRTWMMEAHKQFQKSYYREKEMIDQIKKYRESVSRQVAFHSLLDGQLGYFATKQAYQMNERKLELLNGNTVMIRNLSNGDTALMNFANYYMNPPTDLKEFLPTSYNTSGERYTKNNLSKKKYPNYYYGLPNGWDLSAYRKYFPSIKTNSDVPRLMRILGSSPATTQIAHMFGVDVARTSIFRIIGLTPW